MEPTQPEDRLRTAARKRGVILSILLILFMISNFIAGFLSVIAALRIILIEQPVYTSGSMPGWLVFLFSTFGLVNFVFLMAIWFWKRWGLIGFAAMSLLMVTVQLAHGSPPLVILSSVAGVFLIAAFVIPVRKEFE